MNKYRRNLTVFLAILAFFSSGAYYFNRLLKQYQNQERQAALETLKTTLQEYHQSQVPPGYPKTGEDLEKLLVPLYLDKMPVFPKGKSYHYQSNGQSFTLD